MLHKLPDLHHYNFLNFDLVWIDDVESGGFGFKDLMKSVIARTGAKQHYNHAHEWCCGHGAMGFNLLIHDVCDQLTLSDCYHNAMLGCQITTRINNLQDKVNVCLIDELTDIPVPVQPWDLVITNPPYAPQRQWFDQQGIPVPLRETKWIDPDWKSHRIFFENLHRYSDDVCDVYMFGMLEFMQGQIDLAINNGLELIDIYKDLQKASGNNIELLHFRQAK